MKTVFKGVVSALQVICMLLVISAIACTKPASSEEEKFGDIVYSIGSARYTAALDGMAEFQISLSGASNGARYDLLKLTLYTHAVETENLTLESGTYTLSSVKSPGHFCDVVASKANLGGKFSAVEPSSVTVSESGAVNGRLVLANGEVLNFTTSKRLSVRSDIPDEPVEKPLFTVKVLNNSFYQLNLSITPKDNSMEYFYTVMPTNRFEGMQDSEILSSIHAFYASIISLGMVEKGPVTVTNEEVGIMTPLTEYAVYAYGVAKGNPSTDLFTYKFTTSDQNDPTNVTFTSVISDITKKGASAQVTPSDATVLYVWDLVRKEVLDSYGKVDGEFLNKWLTNQIDGVLWKNIADVVAGCGSRGTQEYTYTSLASNTEYVLFAVCVNGQGEPVSKAYVSEPFKTLESKTSDVYVYQEIVNNNEYYDGDELAKADPSKYASCAGCYYVHMKYVVEKGSPANVYAAFLYDDPKDYTDEQLIAALVKNSKKETEDFWYLVKKSGKTSTTFHTITVADDVNGDFGAVDRYAYYLFSTQCRPISDIIK